MLAVQRRTAPFPFEDGELLPKRENLQSGIGARAEEDTERGQESKEEIEHEPIVVRSCRETTKRTASC